MYPNLAFFTASLTFKAMDYNANFLQQNKMFIHFKEFLFLARSFHFFLNKCEICTSHDHINVIIKID